MLSFKQFLKETPSLMNISDYSKSENVLSDTEARHGHNMMKSDSNYKKISTLGNYEVWHNKSPIGSVFTLVHPKTKHIHMQVTGDFEGNKTFKVDILSGQDKNEIKAHQFYHHLIKKHGLILHSSDLQSQGGMKTWQRLHSDYPDIQIHHDDGYGNKIPLHTDNWKKNYSKKLTDSKFIARKK